MARGDSTDSFHSAMKTLEKKVKNAYSCVPWNPYPIDIWTGRTAFNPVDSVGYMLSVVTIHFTMKALPFFTSIHCYPCM